MQSLSVERVREALDYDQATGVFTRKLRTAQRHQAGDRADIQITSGPMSGYRRIALDSMKVQAHRAAWLYVYGEWPEHHIDHINGDRGDNRIDNLRDVPNGINRQNMRKPTKLKKLSRYLGVTLHQGKWLARVQHQGRCYSAGSHDTEERAFEAYVNLKRKLHQGCTL